METISILVCCYNSENNIQAVVSEIREAFAVRAEHFDYHLVLVNDGSQDRTFEIISRMANEDSRIVAIDLSKNYGPLAAKMAGLQHVDGDYLVYMDDDGQHPVEGIFTLVDELKNGWDVVYADFKAKKYSPLRRFVSKMHGHLMELSIGKPKDVHISSFYAINRMMIEALLKYNSPFPSPIAYMLQVTRKIKSIPMEHQSRLSGSSGYTLKKLFKQWVTVFTSFSIYPLRLAAKAGSLLTFSGLLWILILLVLLIIRGNAQHTSFIIPVIFLVGGLILWACGLIGEYIGRIYMTVSGKPQFSTREVVKHKDE